MESSKNTTHPVAMTMLQDQVAKATGYATSTAACLAEEARALLEKHGIPTTLAPVAMDTYVRMGPAGMTSLLRDRTRQHLLREGAFRALLAAAVLAMGSSRDAAEGHIVLDCNEHFRVTSDIFVRVALEQMGLYRTPGSQISVAQILGGDFSGKDLPLRREGEDSYSQDEGTYAQIQALKATYDAVRAEVDPRIDGFRGDLDALCERLRASGAAPSLEPLAKAGPEGSLALLRQRLVAVGTRRQAYRALVGVAKGLVGASQLAYFEPVAESHLPTLTGDLQTELALTLMGFDPKDDAVRAALNGQTS